MKNQNVTLRFWEETAPALPKNQNVGSVAFYAKDGTPLFFIKRQAAQANSVAADVATLRTDFNNLLVKLRAAGVIAP